MIAGLLLARAMCVRGGVELGQRPGYENYARREHTRTQFRLTNARVDFDRCIATADGAANS